MAAKQPREGAICARYQALKRIGQPEDVVDVVVFLASDGARLDQRDDDRRGC
jgi:NAD(P)-dependent dehydrogenase (short-subunit alcohol dehydrogenase family)